MGNELKEGFVSCKAFSPSETIVLEIAKRTGVDPGDLPPLYESFDPEALDRLVQGQGSFRLTFKYTDYEVTVSEIGCIAIHECGNDRS